MSSNSAPSGDPTPSVPPNPVQEARPPATGGGPAPISQSPNKYRTWLPAWWRQLPRFFGFNEFRNDFELLDPRQLKELLASCDAVVAARIERDIEVLDHEVLRLFRRLDHEAAKQQNRYRRVQLEFALLALVATVLGSIMALTLETTPSLTPWLGLAETVIALLTSFIVALTSDEPPQQLWLQNRLRAEFLRREYFRYLMRLMPYDGLDDDFDRESLLAKRAADINRGFFPELPQPQA
ncbi:MAG: DUF4231 domain-containing protein [Chloroflexi bacterium]|nr:DUF4231 domain-containing protein [Chloroflexota bacterium]